MRISSEIAYCCGADAVSRAEGSIRQRPLSRGRAGAAGVASPGHVSKGIVQEPKRAPDFLPKGEVRDSKGRPEGLRMDREQS